MRGRRATWPIERHVEAAEQLTRIHDELGALEADIANRLPASRRSVSALLRAERALAAAREWLDDAMFRDHWRDWERRAFLLGVYFPERARRVIGGGGTA
jgi:hypothetical protein